MGSVSVPSVQQGLPTGGTWLRRAVILAFVLFAFGLLAATGPAHAQDSKGADFWLTFPRNYYDPPELTLFITGGVATSGVVEVPALAISSTDCRLRAEESRPIWYLVPDGVVQYVAKRDLYRACPPDARPTAARPPDARPNDGGAPA